MRGNSHVRFLEDRENTLPVTRHFPLINNIDNPALAKKIRKVLRNFFSVLKSLNAQLRAIYITGVSKFSKTSLFSGLNNLNDITLDPRAATLLGYTHDEITFFLGDHIKAVANHKEITPEDVIKEMEHWYNGYRFSEKPIKVFNPFSTLYYLEKKKRANYWLNSGTPGFLVELFRKKTILIEELEQVEFSETSLGAFEVDEIPVITLLFQTGYLTIKDYDPVSQNYWLSYPNREVEETVKKHLLALFSKTDIPTVEEIRSKIKVSLEQKNLDLFCKLLQVLFAHIPYQLHLNEERYYHSLFQMVGSLLPLDVQSELSTDKGRIDLVISTDMVIYLFECKFNVSAEKAIEQIKEKRYYERFLHQGKEVMLVGISFMREDKKISIECAHTSID